MKKVKLYFPREFKYGDRVFEGDKVHEIEEEVPGFITRWIKRGCVVVEEEEKEEKVTKKKAKKKTRRKAVDKVENKDENDSDVKVTDELSE